jgi:hypothetical protein
MEFLDLLRFLLIFAIIDIQYLSFIKKIFFYKLSYGEILCFADLYMMY